MKLEFSSPTPRNFVQTGMESRVSVALYTDENEDVKLARFSFGGDSSKYSPFISAAKAALIEAGYSVSNDREPNAFEVGLKRVSLESTEKLLAEFTQQAEGQGFAVTIVITETP